MIIRYCYRLMVFIWKIPVCCIRKCCTKKQYEYTHFFFVVVNSLSNCFETEGGNLIELFLFVKILANTLKMPDFELEPCA